ncbi:MAG TPA: pro-sigmaK processing inhibitor BofA family protein [Syntrophomonadaceae bacterium]|nr:pro-sigmaK processing inhibitor BofA family protein [Syntrophomonadaceae bacterium]
MQYFNVVLAVLLLLVILFFVIQLFLKPIKILWKLVFNSIVGLILLFVVNYIGGYFSFALPYNIITVLIAGFLGIPGILMLIGFYFLIH